MQSATCYFSQYMTMGRYSTFSKPMHMKCTIQFPKECLLLSSSTIQNTLLPLTYGETMSQIANFGIPDLLLPFPEECRKELPKMLLNVSIHSLYFHANRGSFHRKKEPSFDNMCGRVFLPQVTIPGSSRLPPVQKEISKEKMQAANMRRKAWKKRRNLLTMTDSKSKSVRQIFTMHGNIVLRAESSGTCVNFKVLVPLFFSCGLFQVSQMADVAGCKGCPASLQDSSDHLFRSAASRIGGWFLHSAHGNTDSQRWKVAVCGRWMPAGKHAGQALSGIAEPQDR